MDGAEERYTQRLRFALRNATTAAQKLSCASVKPEHLVLGMLEVGQGVDFEAWARLGVEPDRLYSALTRRIANVGEADAKGHALLSLDAQDVVNGAVLEAQGMGHHHIGKEHLLLSLARITDGPVAEVFGELSLTYEANASGRGLRASGWASQGLQRVALPDAACDRYLVW